MSVIFECVCKNGKKFSCLSHVSVFLTLSSNSVFSPLPSPLPPSLPPLPLLGNLACTWTHGRRPLHKACQFNQEGIMDFLLATGTHAYLSFSSFSSLPSLLSHFLSSPFSLLSPPLLFSSHCLSLLSSPFCHAYLFAPN